MNPFLVAATLWRLGHAMGVAPSLHDLLRALAKGTLSLAGMLKAYQAAHGLEATGELDTATERLLMTPRCGLPDTMAARTEPCKWPMNRVTWSQTVLLPGLDHVTVDRIFRRAWSTWSDVCGLDPVEIGPENWAEVVNVVSTSGQGRTDDLDGLGGVLAWSELPCAARPNSRLRQVYDRAESWTEHSLYLVAAHEIGHALGIPHLGPGALMAPYLNLSLTGLTPADVAEAVARYGPRASASPPVPPAPPASAPLTVQVDVTEPGRYLLTLVMTKQP